MMVLARRSSTKRVSCSRIGQRGRRRRPMAARRSCRRWPPLTRRVPSFRGAPRATAYASGRVVSARPSRWSYRPRSLRRPHDALPPKPPRVAPTRSRRATAECGGCRLRTSRHHGPRPSVPPACRTARCRSRPSRAHGGRVKCLGVSWEGASAAASSAAAAATSARVSGPLSIAATVRRPSRPKPPPLQLAHAILVRLPRRALALERLSRRAQRLIVFKLLLR